MRKFITSSVIFLLGTLQIQAQKNVMVKGVAFDSSAKQPIAYATVSLLEKKDSSLISFSMTDDNGRFEFKNIRNGDYRLLITHTNYHNSNKIFSINENDQNSDLGNIVMNDLSKTLPEAVVTTEAPPVTLIDDTVQYNAGSFKTPPNANVEQLLKKLPGVKVEKDGSIEAQGEKVRKVLVDGKEFFGNDPKIATKNLPADAVDKVQVYDRKSDQALLTGFDDGYAEKTINLKLKKDKKKGAFGKVSAGAGTDKKYEGQFNLNSFKGARHISALGMGNNTNAEGFSFMDILSFTGELGSMLRNGGNISKTALEAAAYSGGGNNAITTAWAGGINYNNIIGTKLDLQSNYFYNRYSPATESKIQRRYFLPDSSYFYNQNAVSRNTNNNHRMNFNLFYRIDSMNSIRIIPSFSYQATENKSGKNYQTLSENKSLTNEGFSNTASKNEGFNFYNDMSWRRKLNRRGRTFSVSLQTTLKRSSGSGSLLSMNSFYGAAGALSRKDTLDQINNTTADLRGYTGRLIYTEPVFKRSLLEFSIGKSNTESIARKTTYDYNAQNNKYDRENLLLTNDYKNEYGFINAGIRMRTQKKKYSYSFGGVLQQSALSGKLAGMKDSSLSKTFNNILPNAGFQYNFSRFKNLNLNYSTSANAPDITQLQPVPDNTDPLNIRIGNPRLKQEYVHSVQANLKFLSPFKNKILFAFFTAQAMKNRIVNYDSVSLYGVKYTKPVNVNGIYNLASMISYSMPVKALKATLAIRSMVNYNSEKQFTNTVQNNIKSLVFGPQVTLDVNPTDKLNFTLGAEMNYTHTKYSLRSAPDAKYFSQEYNTSVDWEMPARFFLSTDFSYTINSGRAAGFNTKLPLWNAAISRQMLKFNRGEIKLSARDLLNSNIGISRNSNANYIEDSRVKTLRRFFMLSFTYSLSKVGLNSAGNNKSGVIFK